MSDPYIPGVVLALHQLPSTLTALKQWVVVRLEPNDNPDQKPKKVPYCSHSRRASATNPATWLSYQEAYSIFSRPNSGFHSLGFCLSADITCVDVDKCRDAQTGDLNAEANQLLADFNTWAEISYSGSGLHIWAIGRKPGPNCRKNTIEVYDTGRIITVTGAPARAQQPSDIAPQQEEINALYGRLWQQATTDRLISGILLKSGGQHSSPKEVLAAVITSSAPLAHYLRSGDPIKYFSSASDADFALACACVKFSRDLATAKTAMLDSGVVREKWSSQRGGETWLDLTLRKAAEKLATIADSGEQSISTHYQIALSVCNDLAEYYPPGVRSDGAALRKYEHGMWVELQHQEFLQFVCDRWDHKLRKNGEYQAIIRLATELTPRVDSWDRSGFASAGELWTCGTNGVQSTPLAPEHYATYQSDIRVAPGPTPIWDSFLADALCGVSNQLPLLQELIGLTLTGGLHTLQKAVYIYGPGASGKSLVINLLSDFFPAAAVSGISPVDWRSEYNRHALAKVKLNASTELPQRMSSENVFKSVVAGDPIDCRAPYGQPYTTRILGAHWFSGNDLPTSEDVSTGWYRRFATLSFPNAVPAHKMDPDLRAKLQPERGAIIAWALEGADRAMLLGRLSAPRTEPGSNRVVGADIISIWRGLADPFYEWARDKQLNPTATNEQILEYYSDYRATCAENGTKATDLPKFRLRVRQM